MPEKEDPFIVLERINNMKKELESLKEFGKHLDDLLEQQKEREKESINHKS